MENRTIKLLERETDEVLAFYAAPPETLMADYDLPPGKAIVPRFGPDIESHIVKDGQNVFRHDPLTLPEFEDFIETLDNRLNQEDLIFKNSGIDGKALEIRLAPYGPRGICTAFARARDIMQDEAAKRGGEAFFGSGHWHTSLMMGEQDTSRWNLRKPSFAQSCPSPLARAGMVGIYYYQSLFPALFVKPHIAEKQMGAKMYTGPQQVKIENSYDNSCSVLLAFHKTGSCQTIENRLGLHAPYQPVYLTLAAIRYGIASHGRHPGTGATHSFMTSNVNPGKNPALCRGQGGFMEMLRETQNNLARYRLIPEEVGEAMLEESVRRYEEYLSLPAKTKDYDAQNLQDLRRDVLAFGAIPATYKVMPAP